MTIERDPFFHNTHFDEISNYLEQRMNSLFAPFMEDYRFSVQPSLGRLESGKPGKEVSRVQPPAFSGNWPRLDVVEKEQAVEVTAELPGVRKEDIQVQLDENRLYISAKREETKREENDRYHYAERRFGSMERMVHLPPSVNPEQVVQSSFENGVLHLQFGKKTETETRKQITIQ